MVLRGRDRVLLFLSNKNNKGGQALHLGCWEKHSISELACSKASMLAVDRATMSQVHRRVQVDLTGRA